MFGIGYNLDNFDWKNITFYDPKCRTCTNGKLDNDLVQGTCITKNLKVCSQLVRIIQIYYLNYFNNENIYNNQNRQMASVQSQIHALVVSI